MSHIKNDINQINNKVLLSLDSCLIQAVLAIHLPKLELVNRMFFPKLHSHNLQCDILARPVVRHVEVPTEAVLGTCVVIHIAIG